MQIKVSSCRVNIQRCYQPFKLATESADIMGDQQELDTLRQEVIRLTQELDQTSSEKIQSAQYGLVLLEEKENLEARCQVRRLTISKPKHYCFI